MTNYIAARAAAESLIALLRPECAQIEIAGSLRRGKSDVKDVELVALPSRTPARLLGITDQLLADRVITQAAYGANLTPRWGQSYRGLVYQGVRCELFLANADNWGYIYWLRTGPGDANAYIMEVLARKNSPVRARDGYWWWRERKLTIPAESDLFTLLGLPLIEPQRRTVVAYRAVMESPRWRLASPERWLAPGPAQLSLWD